MVTPVADVDGVSARRGKRRALLGFAFVMPLLLCGLVAPYTVDDAFIVARYARSLADGTGYAMNPGFVSDGITGPLWVLPALAAILVGLDPIAMSKIVGALCVAAAAMVVARWASARAGGALAAWASLIALSLTPDFSTWAVSGLETGLATLCTTLLAAAALARPAPRSALASCATIALAWLRPELAPCAGCLWLVLWQRAGARCWIWLGCALLGSASVVLWRVHMFGDVLPLSAHAKPADLATGGRYVVRGVVLMTSVVGAVLASLGAMRGRRADRYVLAALIVHALTVVLAGGDWMPGARLLVPVAPLYALLLGRGVFVLARSRPAWALGAYLLALSVPVADLVLRIPDLHAAAAARREHGAPLAHYLASHARVVALLDVGYLGYASDREVVDLGGLTDPVIAKLPGGHIGKRIDETLLRARAPDAIVLHSVRPPVVEDGRLRALWGYPVEQRVAAMPWVASAFRVAHVVGYAPDYWYVVLLRGDSSAKR